MVLPPLELFSLRKELPCCRAALSVFEGLPFFLSRHPIQNCRRLGPLLPAGFAEPGVGWFHALEHRVFGAALRAPWRASTNEPSTLTEPNGAIVFLLPPARVTSPKPVCGPPTDCRCGSGPCSGNNRGYQDMICRCSARFIPRAHRSHISVLRKCTIAAAFPCSLTFTTRLAWCSFCPAP